jgi:hypothetical protein
MAEMKDVLTVEWLVDKLVAWRVAHLACLLVAR